MAGMQQNLRTEKSTMDTDKSVPLKNLRANARLAIEQFGPLYGDGFGLDAASVAWVDGFIERQRIRPEFSSPESQAGLVGVIGSFLGEAIIAAYGGEWVQSEHGLGVRTIGGIVAFPFAKVQKQFANGSADSTRSMFTVLPVIAANGAKK
jgi:hypothetical protein